MGSNYTWWGACFSGDIERIDEYLQNGQELVLLLLICPEPHIPFAGTCRPAQNELTGESGSRFRPPPEAEIPKLLKTKLFARS